MPALLVQMFPQQLARARVQHADDMLVPLHLHAPSDPARWRAVVGGVHLHAAIQIHGALAELVEAERLQRKRQQRRFLLGEHRRNLPLGGAVDARVGPRSSQWSR